MFGIESALLDIVTKVYDAIGWPGVVFLMAVESVVVGLSATRRIVATDGSLAAYSEAALRTGGFRPRLQAPS